MKNDDRVKNTEEKEQMSELAEEDLEQTNGGKYVYKPLQQWKKKGEERPDHGEGSGIT